MERSVGDHAIEDRVTPNADAEEAAQLGILGIQQAATSAEQPHGSAAGPDQAAHAGELRLPHPVVAWTGLSPGDRKHRFDPFRLAAPECEPAVPSPPDTAVHVPPPFVTRFSTICQHNLLIGNDLWEANGTAGHAGAQVGDTKKRQ